MENNYANVIEHSIYNGSEMISIEVFGPKFLDAEFEKHRMISSNSSSDRAIPFKTMCRKKSYHPGDLRLNQKGMQGFDRANKYATQWFYGVIDGIHEFSVNALESVDFFHKQHLNRYLLPYSMQTKIMTATRDEWDYFLSLRLHEAADPNIYNIAEHIYFVINESVPRQLQEHMWHLPYVYEEERDTDDIELLLKISAARCARTSYKLHDGKTPTVEEDLALFDFLANAKPGHFSPMDHQAKPAEKFDLATRRFPRGVTRLNLDTETMEITGYGSGNFNNWIQFRHWHLQGVNK